jgi:hypothetical protein
MYYVESGLSLTLFDKNLSKMGAVLIQSAPLQGDSKVLWIHLFCLYNLCLKEHRKNVTARLKLRF